jgi:integrase
MKTLPAKAPASFPAAQPEVFPFSAGPATGAIRMYRTKTRSFDEFKIPFQKDGTRRFHTFRTYAEARAKGNEMLAQLGNGDGRAATLTGRDQLVYGRAIDSLRPIGVDLDRAAADYVRFWQAMGGDHFQEAIDLLLARRKNVNPITVSDLVARFIEQKTASTKHGKPASQDYVKDLESRLGEFSTRFPGPISTLTPEIVETFLDGLRTPSGKPVASRTRFNYARLLRTLFRFAQVKRFLPKDLDLMEGISITFDDTGEIEIFSPAEMSRFLHAARPELVPFLALGAFAGLRHKEIKRLDWAEVDLDRGFIEVKAAKAKTRSRRLVPIHPNLKAWLEPHKTPSGPVVKFANCAKQILWLVRDINSANGDETAPEAIWKHNATRHSFISYRLAEIQSVDIVALEAGNSPQMIFKHYRELVRPDESKAWFSIFPNRTIIG